jgi:hypothetical protein
VPDGGRTDGHFLVFHLSDAGMVKLNREPSPSVLSTLASPPCA